MKLSILVPEYNQKCFPLAFELHKQCIRAGVDFELIVADDASTDTSVVEANRPIGELENARFLEEHTNRGRAALRNYLTKTAKGEYLLFVDSDAIVPDDRFIERYLTILREKRAVVYGGVTHRPLDGKKSSLRLRYELACDRRFTLSYRQKHPYQNLRTLNILLSSSVAQQFPFDESIQLYGYEDTLLGRTWEEVGIEVLHIQNPLIDADMESNEVFLAKTEEALRSLLVLGDRMQGYSALLDCYHTIQKWHLTAAVRLFFSLFASPIRRNLVGNNPQVRLFQLYKLGYYSKISVLK